VEEETHYLRVAVIILRERNSPYPTAPLNPNNGEIWYDTGLNTTWVYMTDPIAGWVQAAF
jgi:hypothetical protein